MSNNNKIEYIFAFGDNKTQSFSILQDKFEIKCDNNNIANCTNYMNCGKCVLLDKINEYINYFSNFISYENTSIKVVTKDRIYFKDATFQEGVRSLLGLVMPYSGCPFFAKLIPMARFHLPFSNIEETQFRVIGMYLFAQFLKKKKGLETDWDMKYLIDIYMNIREINRKICDYIRSKSFQDASINAIIILDILADQVIFSIDEMEFEYFENLFSSYLTDK